MHGKTLSRLTRGRLVLEPPKPDHLKPEERLAQHQASVHHRGPNPGGTVRVTMRNRLGDEKPTVRKMYDRTVKPRRRRRRKES